jgi:spermidine synthase
MAFRQADKALLSDGTPRQEPNKLLPIVELQEKQRGRMLWPVFVVSFTALYLEILLIRWIGTEVRVFAYFQNLALIACFLGFGLGCYQSAMKKRYLFGLVALTILVILVELPFHQWKVLLEMLSSGLSLSRDAQLWSAFIPSTRTVAIELFLFSVALTSALLLLIIETMRPVGQWVGMYLDDASDPIAAYSVNLLGSIAGIWFFAWMSFMQAAPVLWFGAAFALFVVVRRRDARFGIVQLLLIAASLLLLFHADFRSGEMHWSPYQKLQVIAGSERQYSILVNNVGYMTMANVSADSVARHPEFAARYKDSAYDAPWRFIGARDRVLIVGAGAGNDADAALRNGAGQVDAVEIDPEIYALGKHLHPDQPYASDRVHVILNDARAYLRKTEQKYDIIIFGLLDSHTQFSSYSNMRIDNYVYTEQSLREAKRLLKPSGVLVVRFYVSPPWTWMGQRFYAMFNDIFGRPPIAFHRSQIGGLVEGTLFLASNDGSLWDRAAKPELAAFVQASPTSFPLVTEGAPPKVTDDWPYVYQFGHTVPRTYLTVSLILLIVAFSATRKSLEPRKLSTWYFCFLGAGFLLLETQMISRLALYFGSTWQVNCVVLSAILAVLLVANLIVQRVPTFRLGWLYAILIITLIAIYVLPWESIRVGTHVLGMLLAAAYCIPVFFAGVIFADNFRNCQNRSTAFGSNIIGAVAGGLAQNLSFVVGLKALLLLAAVFYGLAALFNVFAAYRTKENQEAVVAAPTWVRV